MAIAAKGNHEEHESLREFTWKEIGEHKSHESLWIVVDGLVYDITSWLGRHPGGDIVLLYSAGVDCTDVFNAYHPHSARKMLKHYHIGRVEQYSLTPFLKEFRQLASSVEASSLMRTDGYLYIKLILWYTLLLGSSIYALIKFSDDVWIGAVLSGFLMSMFFQQIAFLGHDLGHTSVSHKRKIDNLAGLFCGNALSGISMGWWKATHNTHHVTTNAVMSDPDIQHLPFFAVSSKFFESIHSAYHNRVLKFDVLAKLLVPIQAKLYYIVMAFARFNLYAQSYVFLLSGEGYIRERIKTQRSAELGGLVAFALWFSYLVSYLPDWKSRLVFLIVSHGLAGILHVQITLSHFAMPVYTEKHPLRTHSFFEHQLNTSLDIDCSPWMDWFHGGLNFQAAHHVFPRVPRNNLRKLRGILQEFSKKHDIPYICVDFVEANRRVLTHLNSVGMEARNQIIVDMLNLRG